MAEVKWIRLNIDMFDNSKIKYIRTLPEGSNIVLIWVMLLTKAGKCNNHGRIYLTEDIPYTTDMLAAEFGINLNTVIIALEILSKLNMIHQTDRDIEVVGWEEYQNIDGLEKIKEQNRIRKQKQRERDKIEDVSHVTCHADITQNHATEEELELEEDKEEDKEKDKENNKINYQLIVDMYNDICVSFPKCTKLSDARKKAIKARLNIYTVVDMRNLFEMAESSRFLKGENDRNWTASFDWLMKDANMAKVFDGNYLNKQKQQIQQKQTQPKPNKFHNFEQRTYNYEDLEQRFINKVNGINNT